mmetsp:Transcript_101470/g.293541  ORF Transcript_101470/g.293541 Transcript_101470/m.293541 type:complete len:239 (+) Transcript_101470:99-815(+)
MNLYSKLVLALVTSGLAAPAVAQDDHDHEHEMEDCAEYTVSDAASCETWCGPDMTSEWIYTAEHGDFEDMHVDYLAGWECHCEPSTETATARSETDGEKICFMAYELPTCQSEGLADCGSNATMTCGELCDAVGLGLGGSTVARMLGHSSDQHFCAHHEGEEHDHERRILAEEDHHDHEEAVTICFCNADSEADEGSTIACSDANLLEGHDDHGSGSGRPQILAGLTFLATSFLYASL